MFSRGRDSKQKLKLFPPRKPANSHRIGISISLVFPWNSRPVFPAEHWKQIQKFSPCYWPLPIALLPTLLLNPTKQATGTPELLPGNQNCRTSPSRTVLRLLQRAGSRLLLRPTALWGWCHPFILPSLSIPCLTQFDAAIKIDGT